MQRLNWNVNVRASWNLAILTPRGIAERLFGLPTDTPVEVRVPLDGRHPFQVLHDGLVVVASEDQLLIEPDVSNFANLRKAMQLGARAMQELPETPFVAAGYNLRYRADPVPDALLDFLACDLDNRLADAGHVLTTRRRAASWKYMDGSLNLDVALDDTSCVVVLNFHRTSTDGRVLQQWLNCPLNKIEDAAEALLETLALQDATVERRNV
jgi:hypothetical protein